MAEAQTDEKVGIKVVRYGQTAGLSGSGRRVVQKEGAGTHLDPLKYVERTKIEGREVCEQVLSPGSSAHSWIYYTADKEHIIPVEGLLLDNGRSMRLIWVPSEGTGFSEVDLLELTRKKYPDSRTVVSFRLGAPVAEGTTPELVLKSASPTSDEKINPLIDYFGNSLDWNEQAIRIRTYPAGQKIKEFEGNLQQYLMLQ